MLKFRRALSKVAAVVIVVVIMAAGAIGTLAYLGLKPAPAPPPPTTSTFESSTELPRISKQLCSASYALTSSQKQIAVGGGSAYLVGVAIAHFYRPMTV